MKSIFSFTIPERGSAGMIKKTKKKKRNEEEEEEEYQLNQNVRFQQFQFVI